MKSMISRIDHVSLAVKDFEKAKNFFMEILGAIPCTNAEDGNLKYYWEIFSLGDLTRIIHEFRFAFGRGGEGEAVYSHTANPHRQSSGANMDSPLVKKFR